VCAGGVSSNGTTKSSGVRERVGGNKDVDDGKEETEKVRDGKRDINLTGIQGSIQYSGPFTTNQEG